MASSSDSLMTNYARIGHATQQVFPDILQDIIAIMEPQHRLYGDVTSNRYLNRNLQADEWSMINNACTNGYVNFDIPLIYKLVRNLNLVPPPTKGWDFPKSPTDTEILPGDDIERIRRTRNEILHRGNAQVSDSLLTEYFSCFKDIAIRLEAYLGKPKGEFLNKFYDLEKCCMDAETEKTYLERLTILRERDLNLSRAVAELRKDVDILKELQMGNVPSKIKDVDEVKKPYRNAKSLKQSESAKHKDTESLCHLQSHRLSNGCERSSPSRTFPNVGLLVQEALRLRRRWCKILFFVGKKTKNNLPIMLECVCHERMAEVCEERKKYGYHNVQGWTSKDFFFCHDKTIITVDVKGKFRIPKDSKEKHPKLSFISEARENFTRFPVELKTSGTVYGILTLRDNKGILDEILYDPDSSRKLPLNMTIRNVFLGNRNDQVTISRSSIAQHQRRRNDADKCQSDQNEDNEGAVVTVLYERETEAEENRGDQ